MRRVARHLPACAMAFGLLFVASPGGADETGTKFAMVGDFGWFELSHDRPKQVAAMVNGWDVDFMISLGDENYHLFKERNSFDKAAGRLYCRYIQPFRGAIETDEWGQPCSGSSDGETGFFPVPGNHSYNSADEGGYTPYMSYFSQPLPAGAQASEDSNTVGTDGYYTFARGPVRFFGINSNCTNPDGTSCQPGSPTCASARTWLVQALRDSDAAWNLVFLHHPLFNGGSHGGCQAVWYVMEAIIAVGGQDHSLVVSGHEHQYERITIEDPRAENPLLFVVNGSGGTIQNACCSEAIVIPEGSTLGEALCYSKRHGAMLVEATETRLWYGFFQHKNGEDPIDECTLTRAADGSVSRVCVEHSRKIKRCDEVTTGERDS